MTSKNWKMFLVAGVLCMALTPIAQAALTEDYLSLSGDTGEYKYASGFGDDTVIPGHTAIDFTGAITNNSDKYLTDALALGNWSRNGTLLGCYSSASTDLVYKVSMSDEGASGYTIDDGEIHVRTRIYQAGGTVELFVSKDNVNWSSAIMTDSNSVNGWVNTNHDIDIPDAYLGGDALYVKFTGSTPSANDWATVYQWGVRMDLVPEPATMSLLLLGLPLALRRRRK